MLDNIHFVLIGTTHPGNIGAAARAMKTMGLSRLRLVAPASFPHAEATARASGADDLLQGAGLFDDLDEALAGCALVVGTSARRRTIPWPVAEPREAAERLCAAAREAPVAVLFGREHSGLSNDELDRCSLLVEIPTNPAFSSLNLGAAVQVVAYELALAAREAPPPPAERDSPLATEAQRQGLYQHMEQALLEIGFLDPAAPRQLMRRLRRLYNRIDLEEVEVNILRGVLKSAQRRSGR